MPRVEHAHAIYHVINRGNYRSPIFASVGAAEAFERCLWEAASRYGWRIHAFALMSNHFHLAVETSEANLAQSMHWLGSTYATRFNRYRSQHGHLFQGRYRALLVQPGPSLLRVVNYIHLNPVRAGLTELANLPEYRWTSLRYFLRAARPETLVCADWLRELRQIDDATGWMAYGQLLTDLARDPARQKRDGFDGMSRGWAIGEKAWRQDIATRFSREGAAESPAGPERDALRDRNWRQELDRRLKDLNRSEQELQLSPKSAKWKIALAVDLRDACGANYRWLARALTLGRPDTARHQVSRWRRMATAGSLQDNEIAEQDRLPHKNSA
jgi:REP element-mobilizing transposase RayT